MKRKSLTQTLVDSGKELDFDRATVDKLESLNIPIVRPLSSKEIIAIRRQVDASQGVFAKCLNVNPSTVQKWEQGTVKPRAAALRLLNLIRDKGIQILFNDDVKKSGTDG